MHTPMSQQYLHDFDIFGTPHLHSHAVPHQTQPLTSYGYDSSNYAHDPYAQFDMSKPVNQFQHIPSQQPYTSTSSVNQFHLSSYAPHNMYPPPDTKRHRPTTSISSDDSLPTPTLGRQSALRVPRFERTYTDALEDELYDESSSNASQSVNSQNQMSRHSTPNFAFSRVNQYPNQVYMDKNLGTPTMGQSGQQRQQQPQQRQHSRLNPNGPPENGFYNPLGNPHDPQRLSSTAVADSVRRLQAPNRTTVSPREAFLDYPDSADFREKTLFSKSASPYSQTQDTADVSQHQETDSSASNDDEYSAADAIAENPVPMSALQYPITDLRQNANSLTVPTSSPSTSSSTRNSGVLSRDMSAESGNSSDSEYDPTVTSVRRASRSSGRSGSISKSFACPECGKRFDKAQPLQTHRRNFHGKGSGPPALNTHRFSHTSHRCDWVDPTTGKTCNTVFSRPYDLIRHYETKHSAKRQEFICPHCEDKKSFSRSDALRRHLRVKHPASGRK